MQVGDLVKWIGFPGANVGGINATGPGDCFGIIVKIQEIDNNLSFELKPIRLDVLWSKGIIGRGLYPQTVELVVESR